MTQAPPVRSLVNSQLKACFKVVFAAQKHKSMSSVLEIPSPCVFVLGQNFLCFLTVVSLSYMILQLTSDSRKTCSIKFYFPPVTPYCKYG